MKNKFKKGLFLGSLLTIAAAIGLSVGKEEKELTEDITTELSNLSKNLQKKLYEVETITKKSYNKLVTVLVNEYVEKKEVTEDVKRLLITELQKKWKEMEADYNKEINKKK